MFHFNAQNYLVLQNLGDFEDIIKETAGEI